jgi:glutamine synthetase
MIATFITINTVEAFVVLPTTVSTNIASPSTTSSSLSIGGVIPLNRVTGQSQLDPVVIQKYMDLPMPTDTVLAEYVWVDAVGNTRSKTRTLPVGKVR